VTADVVTDASAVVLGAQCFATPTRATAMLRLTHEFRAARGRCCGQGVFSGGTRGATREFPSLGSLRGTPMSPLQIRVLPTLVAAIVGLAACSSTPEARYTPGNIDNSASDASGTAIRQAESVSPAEVPADCKNTPASVRSRVAACNPPKGPVNEAPAENSPPR
jgi:hypothetical protein